MKKLLLRILTTLCCLSFSVALFGCVGAGTPTDSGNGTPSVEEPEEPIYKPESLDKAISLGEMDFSAWNGTGADSDDRTIKSDKLLGNVKAVYLSSDVNYENNLYKDEKIAIENFENSVKIVDVVICTDHETDNVYLATLNVYTRLITNAKDLRMFDQGSTASEWRKITGCYALTKNIIDPAYIYNLKSIQIQNYYASPSTPDDDLWLLGLTRDEDGNLRNEEGEVVQYVNAASMFGFAGSFDGRGHSLTFSCGSGLFNQLLFGAEVKNVAFKEINIHSGPSPASQQHDYMRRSPIGGSFENYDASAEEIKISNVFISLGETSFYEENVVTKGCSLLPYANSGMVSLENVVVDVDYEYARLLDGADPNRKNNFYLMSYARYLADSDPFTNVFAVVRNQSNENEEYFTPFYQLGNVLSNEKYLQKEYYEEKLPVFETFEDLSDSISDEALIAFDNGFWDISAGYPVWKN
ncbi:MAG: hypothetical protein IJ506_06505 [Clostridia bacterium]|nr:hypothetical protein [Clostridia bacterium]